MRQYFYAEGDQQLGPFSFDELKTKNLSPDTLVWFEGMTDWTRAGDVQELAELFTASTSAPPPPQWEKINPDTPPPRSQSSYASQQSRYQPNRAARPKSWLTEAILVTLFCCLPFGIAAIVNAAKVDSRVSAGDMEGAEAASQEAGKWVKVSFWLGIVVVVLYFLYIAVVIGASGAF